MTIKNFKAKFDIVLKGLAELPEALLKHATLTHVLSDLGLEARGEPFRYENEWSYLGGISLIAQINELDLSRWLKLIPDEYNDIRKFLELLKTLNSGIQHVAKIIRQPKNNNTDVTLLFLEDTLVLRNFQLYRQALQQRNTVDLGLTYCEELDSAVTGHIATLDIIGQKDDYWSYSIFSAILSVPNDFEASIQITQQAIDELRVLYTDLKKGCRRNRFDPNGGNANYTPTLEVAFAAQSYRDYMEYARRKN
ncbi:hypothetical protein J6I92_11360 [Pseudidiomarina sp. 1APR75-15]|nr:hypothetical protein [Pseudidiomarina sp. 1APR75-15]